MIYKSSKDMYEILRRDPQIWDLFSCKEEYYSPMRDRYDRILYYASRNHDIFKPKTSQYLIDHGYSIDYPNNARFAICLTHDIDNVYQYIPQKLLAAFHQLEHTNAIAAIKLLSQIRSKKLPYCNFSEIMDIEEKFGAKSTFFVMAESQGDPTYPYEIEAIEPEIKEIIDRGWEIGLHGGHTTYLNKEEMMSKKARLEKVTRKHVIGYRNHYLRFRVPDTWECLEQAGFQYDSTFGYADCSGFRNGLCHPFQPYNLITGKTIGITELPLIIIDHTLSKKMCLDEQGRWELTRNLIDATEQCHGVVTILFHNTHMISSWRTLYEKILRYGKDKGAFISSGEEILKLVL